MDTLREEEAREINHHGKTISVNGTESDKEKLFQKTLTIDEIPTYNDMTQRNEKELVQARKVFYEQAKFNVRLLSIGQLAAKKGIPVVILTFSTCYWTYGLYYYLFPAF